ncbi:hypothetical protein Dda_8652 [Drechslerella dactyloides]|uniref:Uncharacterized protein n=1 Tax=Drechslerella dactyloides TaxID=74499 RepID=A0AAD6ISG8_DREDA|nr:hypothetical protein Dda_8652 [Drechslerella dactyloides]
MVAPDRVANGGAEEESYGHRREHRHFTPKKVYNFDRLQPSGLSSHPESVKRRAIVGKKTGLDAAKFTIRETARSRRRHRKDALRKTRKYQEMTEAEQHTALTEIDDVIQKEVAASDKEAELAWAAKLSEEGQRPIAVAVADADKPDHKAKGERNTPISPSRRVSHEFKDPGSCSGRNYSISRKPLHHPFRPHLYRIDPSAHDMSKSQAVSATSGTAAVTSMSKENEPLAPAGGAALAASATTNGQPSAPGAKPTKSFRLLRHRLLQDESARFQARLRALRAQPKFQALNKKKREVKIRAIEREIKAERQVNIRALKSQFGIAFCPPRTAASPDQSSDSLDWSEVDSDEEEAAVPPVNPAPPKVPTTVTTPSAETTQKSAEPTPKRSVTVKLPEKTRLHNRGKSSPKKRRFAPIEFEAVEKASQNTADDLSRATRSRTADNHVHAPGKRIMYPHLFSLGNTTELEASTSEPKLLPTRSKTVAAESARRKMLTTDGARRKEAHLKRKHQSGSDSDSSPARPARRVHITAEPANDDSSSDLPGVQVPVTTEPAGGDKPRARPVLRVPATTEPTTTNSSRARRPARRVRTTTEPADGDKPRVRPARRVRIAKEPAGENSRAPLSRKERMAIRTAEELGQERPVIRRSWRIMKRTTAEEDAANLANPAYAQANAALEIQRAKFKAKQVAKQAGLDKKPTPVTTATTSGTSRSHPKRAPRKGVSRTFKGSAGARTSTQTKAKNTASPKRFGRGSTSKDPDRDNTFFNTLRDRVEKSPPERRITSQAKITKCYETTDQGSATTGRPWKVFSASAHLFKDWLPRGWGQNSSEE